MSSLTDEQKRRIEENKKKALEKLKNKSPVKKTSNSSGTSRPNASTSSSTSLFSNALKKYEFNETKKQSNPIDHNLNTNLNGIKTNNLKNYYSPPKDRPVSSSKPNMMNTGPLKGYLSPPKSDKPKIHLILSMKNSIWFQVDHNARYSNDVGTVAQTFSSRQFDQSKKLWNLHVKDYKDVVAKFEKELNVSIDHIPSNVVTILQDAHRKHKSCKDIDLSKIDPNILDKLMDFQKDGIRFGVHRKGRILLADDMGLGKTVQAISLCSYYKDEWPILVICPSSVKMSWQQHFIQWIEDVEAKDVNIVHNGKNDPSCGKINIISYDLASKLVGKIYRKQFKVIVADECHFLKNHNAARTKNIVPLLQGTRRAILLSGTPALSRPKELYTQIKALDRTLFPEYHKFSIRYCDGRQTTFGWSDCGSTNDSELQAVLTSTFMIRRMKHEVLHQLPEKQRQIVYLDPTLIKTSKQLNNDEKQFLNSKSDKKAALLNYFQKTCETKLKGVCEYVSEKIEARCKIIVFAHHMMMLDSIQNVAVTKKVEYIRIDGGTNQKQRQAMVDLFNERDDCLLAVLSLTSCGTGLNITGSSNVVFAELYWNPGHLKQAEDRAYRIGQKNSVLITYLVAKKTADDYIWPMVQNKLKVLTNLGVGSEKGFSGKTTNQDLIRQRSVLDFFETLNEQDEKDFVDQIDSMNEIGDKKKIDEKKTSNDNELTSTDEKTTINDVTNVKEKKSGLDNDKKSNNGNMTSRDGETASNDENITAKNVTNLEEKTSELDSDKKAHNDIDDLFTDDLTADDFNDDILDLGDDLKADDFDDDILGGETLLQDNKNENTSSEPASKRLKIS